MIHKSSIRIRRAFRQVFRHRDPPQRVARGIAAGFFAAAIPLPGFQIPLSLIAAWVVRGNKTVAIFPQFLSNAGTMLPIAWCQLWVGMKIWHGHHVDVGSALDSIKKAGEAWAWSAPWESLNAVAAALGHLGANVVGPLCIGVGVTGFAAALLSYPISLIIVTYYHGYQARRRAERGIGLRPPRGYLLIPEVRELESDAHILDYAVRPETYTRADSVALLVDGCQAYPDMLRAIDEAKKMVRMETYILRADRIGKRFAAALSAAAQRGVDVRLAFDGVGSMGLPQEYMDELLRSGVRLAVYRPLTMLWKLGLGSMNRRNHRKILVIDGKTAFTGGLNIGDEYNSKDNGGGDWRDTHLRIDGAEPARQLQVLVDRTWKQSHELKSTHPEMPVSPTAVEAPCAIELPVAITSRNVRLQVINNREFLQRVRMRRAYIHAIHRARRYILIENAYFIPDRGIRRALRKAVKRGVIVGVVVAMYSDVQIAALASRALYADLLQSGVRLFEYPRSMMHCKTAVIDDVWSIVSSYNLDHRSLKHNLEAGVFLIDRATARAIRDQVLKDISHCREVTQQFHESRPWDHALYESLAYQARYWL